MGSTATFDRRYQQEATSAIDLRQVFTDHQKGGFHAWTDAGMANVDMIPEYTARWDECIDC